VLLTGEGERAFIAGADIVEMSKYSPAQAAHASLAGGDLAAAIEACPQIVIAVINGFALGGGCELAMACDLLYAAEEAELGQPEIKLGIMPGFGGCLRLPRLLGRARAMELLTLGDRLKARDALELGLLTGVFPRALLRTRVTEIATRIASMSGPALASIKRAVHGGGDLPIERAAILERSLFACLFAGEDMREGTAAFLEKRDPRF